jgi:hypothetical protein
MLLSYFQGQPSEHEPCYQMTADMEMIFTFHPASDAKSSNFTYASADFVWKYELQLKTGILSFLLPLIYLLFRLR